VITNAENETGRINETGQVQYCPTPIPPRFFWLSAADGGTAPMRQRISLGAKRAMQLLNAFWKFAKKAVL
jgi:hypothetical protein